MPRISYGRLMHNSDHALTCTIYRTKVDFTAENQYHLYATFLPKLSNVKLAWLALYSQLIIILDSLCTWFIYCVVFIEKTLNWCFYEAMLVWSFLYLQPKYDAPFTSSHVHRSVHALKKTHVFICTCSVWVEKCERVHLIQLGRCMTDVVMLVMLHACIISMILRF